jgi:glycosyltransferase involved in cell wall biosynthesis
MARILFVAERFPPDVGGLATSGGRISRSLAELGLEVDVIAWSRLLEAGKVQEQLTDLQGLRVFRVGQFRQWDMTMPATVNVVEWLMSQRPYDFIWGHYLFPAGFLATWIGQLHNVKTIVSVRGNDLDREMFPPGDFSRLLWTLNHATTVTAVSRDMARKIEAVSARNDSIVLPNAVDSDLFAPVTVRSGLRDQLGIARDELVLGFSGELREKKGTPFLLQALSEIREERPACLLIIGEVRAQQKATMQLYAAEHPDDAARVIVTGHLERVEDVVAHLQLCDVYLQPSLFEGMPNALLEAMACGRLCIASDAGGIPEIIDHGSNGFMVPRAHLDHLSTAIDEAISLDSSLKESIEQNARQTIIDSFCLEKERQLLAKVVAPLLSIVR